MQTVFTEHSLFGFGDVSSMLTNTLLHFTTSTVDQIICVSHTRLEITPAAYFIFIIPVKKTWFCDRMLSQTLCLSSPMPSTRLDSPPIKRTATKNSSISWLLAGMPIFDLHQILHRYSCSLVLRKGVGLLAPVIERVCSAVPGARFIIGGDGPLRLLIEETRDKYNVCSQ